MTQTYSRQDLVDAKAVYEKKYMDALISNAEYVQKSAKMKVGEFYFPRGMFEVPSATFEVYKQYYRACVILLDHIDGFQHLSPKYQEHSLTYRTQQHLIDMSKTGAFSTLDLSMVNLLCQYRDAQELFGN